MEPWNVQQNPQMVKGVQKMNQMVIYVGKYGNEEGLKQEFVSRFENYDILKYMICYNERGYSFKLKLVRSGVEEEFMYRPKYVIFVLLKNSFLLQENFCQGYTDDIVIKSCLNSQIQAMVPLLKILDYYKQEQALEFYQLMQLQPDPEVLIEYFRSKGEEERIIKGGMAMINKYVEVIKFYNQKNNNMKTQQRDLKNCYKLPEYVDYTKSNGLKIIKQWYEQVIDPINRTGTFVRGCSLIVYQKARQTGKTSFFLDMIGCLQQSLLIQNRGDMDMEEEEDLKAQPNLQRLKMDMEEEQEEQEQEERKQGEIMAEKRQDFDNKVPNIEVINKERVIYVRNQWNKKHLQCDQSKVRMVILDDIALPHQPIKNNVLEQWKAHIAGQAVSIEAKYCNEQLNYNIPTVIISNNPQIINLIMDKKNGLNQVYFAVLDDDELLIPPQFQKMVKKQRRLNLGISQNHPDYEIFQQYLH